jgi:hypothetical protein
VKLRQKLRIALQPGTPQNTREVRVGDDFLFDLVAPVRIAVYEAIGERIRLLALHLRVKMALLFVEEGLAV